MTTLTLDIERLRAETPGCRNVLHFNNAGAALMPSPVTDAVIEHLRLESEIGGYEAARMHADKIDRVYESAARLIGADRAEIALLQNATQAWCQAFYAIPFKPGDRILTSISEYASNYLAFLQVAERTGARIEPVPDDESGQLSLEALEAMMDERVKLIAMTHIPTNGGLINPAEEVGRLAKKHGILYLLDACQSVGQLPIDVRKIGCDFLSATSRKYLRGPRGVGFLYVKKEHIEMLDPVMIDLHAATWTGKNSYEIRRDARRFETWESDYAAKIGMGVAMGYAMKLGLETIWERIQSLSVQLRQTLEANPRIRTRDLGARKCGIVSFTVEGASPSEVFQYLGEHHINVSVSLMESTRLDMESRGLKNGVVRASVHYYNTEDEVERFCEVLKKLP